MMKNKSIKKVTKHFSDFSKEEEWLQSMLHKGWILKSYDSEDVDDCQYVFEPLNNEELQHVIYKIDFREFNKKEEFEEYKEIFQESGWTLLSKNKWYSKHIFYTTSANAQRDIFSDQSSYRDREKRKMSSSLMQAAIYLIGFIIFLVLYRIFERSAFGGVGIFSLFFSFKYLVDYYKHRKTLKSLL
ncbi:DUF2812 domain-containing protein [Metabacillus malikii]|uniref:DUF2812 domain-containing protein n=1 Tax=Metabacillus malikii TaxID=1504265 RepID=A0ABT9ZA66_9BACI|nr:DUF2812 domain-containing protein [Metabacillus malikii]MDQ0229138.1 hypothetical protein [Metabacillus malikii]